MEQAGATYETHADFGIDWGWEPVGPIDPKTGRARGGYRRTPLRSTAEAASMFSPVILPAAGITVAKLVGASWLAASGIGLGIGLVAFVAWIPVARALNLPAAPIGAFTG